MTRVIQASEQPIDAAYIEKFPVNVDLQSITADSDHLSDVTSIDAVQRRLKQRHVQMYILLSTLTSPYSSSVSISGLLQAPPFSASTESSNIT